MTEIHLNESAVSVYEQTLEVSAGLLDEMKDVTAVAMSQIILPRAQIAQILQYYSQQLNPRSRLNNNNYAIISMLQWNILFINIFTRSPTSNMLFVDDDYNSHLYNILHTLDADYNNNFDLSNERDVVTPFHSQLIHNFASGFYLYISAMMQNGEVGFYIPALFASKYFHKIVYYMMAMLNCEHRLLRHKYDFHYDFLVVKKQKKVIINFDANKIHYFS